MGGKLSVGKKFHVGEDTLKVKRQIGQGGFAFVFLVKNKKTKEYLALKQTLIQDESSLAQAQREAALLKLLSPHNSIVGYKGEHLYRGKKKTLFFLLTEYCPGGSLQDIVNNMLTKNEKFPEATLLSQFEQVCEAVKHMHSHSPPVIHLDLKTENLLISSDKRLKLCDFGSAETAGFSMDSAEEIELASERIERTTTLVYRAPELLEMKSCHYPINEKADIWALGCVLFLMAFQAHPFQDGQLRILNGKYDIPANCKYSSLVTDLLQMCFEVNPNNRASIDDILLLLRGSGIPQCLLRSREQKQKEKEQREKEKEERDKEREAKKAAAAAAAAAAVNGGSIHSGSNSNCNSALSSPSKKSQAVTATSAAGAGSAGSASSSPGGKKGGGGDPPKTETVSNEGGGWAHFDDNNNTQPQEEAVAISAPHVDAEKEKESNSSSSSSTSSKSDSQVDATGEKDKEKEEDYEAIEIPLQKGQGGEKVEEAAAATSAGWSGAEGAFSTSPDDWGVAQAENNTVNTNNNNSNSNDNSNNSDEQDELAKACGFSDLAAPDAFGESEPAFSGEDPFHLSAVREESMGMEKSASSSPSSSSSSSSRRSSEDEGGITIPQQ